MYICIYIYIHYKVRNPCIVLVKNPADNMSPALFGRMETVLAETMLADLRAARASARIAPLGK